MLGPVPEQSETLLATIVTRPTDQADQLHDALWNDWRQAIAAGARAQIRKNHEPWHDPQREAMDLDRFERAISDASMRRAKGNTGRALRTSAYYF